MARRVLILVAHKDDEALIAGGILTLDGYSFLVVSSCAADEEREKVFYSNASKHGFKAECLGFRDCSLGDNIPELADSMHSVISRFKPDVIISNHFIDVHQDHRAHAQAVIIAANPLKVINKVPVTLVFGYGCSLYEHSEKYVSPNAFVELNNEQVAAKAGMMESYNSEIRKNRSAESIHAYSRAEGFRFGVELAEAYYIMRTGL